MACNGAKKPLLSGLVDSTSPRIDECRRRFRRVKSAPVTELVPSDISGNGPIPRYESFFGGRHQSLKQVAVFLAVYLGLGTLCFYVVRGDIKGKKSNPILDSLYFCIVTMTTVGYGDLVPDSAPVKLLACVFVFTGMLLIGLILSKAADYLVEKQEILLIKALRMHQKLDPAAFLKEIETNKVKYKCYLAIIILSVLMLVGTIFLYMVEDLDIIDAFYCVCSTVTTLGQLFLYIAELFTESRQRALVNWVLTRRMTHLDLEAADIDDDGVVGAAEFVVYKLKEMGKISEEDIALVMKEFEDLDVDQSGTLSASDIMAQATQTHK
uniref:Potassium channel domain-containing protein n=1 Tax=Populus trichocarpa TaxID=3694 RepID=A0A2K2C9H1_POPTR